MAGKQLIGLLMGAGLLGGCVFTSIQETQIDPYYTPDLVRGIAANGEFPTQVRGSPFADHPDVADKVLARLRMPGMFPQARFVPARSTRQHRVVLVFGPASLGLRGKEACGKLDGMKLAPDPDQLDIVAAFCVADQVLTQIRVQGAAVPGPDDPAFGRVLDQTIVSLLPSNEVDRTGDCEAGAPC
ncbi:MAG: hypothetical protein QF797_01260 [Alphaproteobacteria bacterium]|nr:hypothetical protein [Alphaproteobacteria bacterium]MDP6622808.1 hypothetical protein [Alphaproteobacteria bacterium]